MKRNRIVIRTNASIPFLYIHVSSNDINIFNLTKKNEESCFEIEEKNLKKVCDLFSKNGKEYSIVSERRSTFAPQKILSRMGIVIGLLIYFILIYFYSTVVLHVKTIGTNVETVENCVNEMIDFPVLKKNLNTAEIRKAVCKLDSVSDASVVIEGNVLYVTALEEQPKTALPKDTINSLYDAIVTKVVVYEGECLIKVGDNVKSGDVLIKASDKKAKGDIYGRVWYTERRIIPNEEIKMVRTGKSETIYGLAGRERKYKGSFVMYEKESSIAWLPLVIPVRMQKNIYYEVVEERRKIDFELQKEAIISTAFVDIEKKLPNNAYNPKKWFLIKTVDKTVVLDLYYEIEVKISS